jgi:hypothetical protein
MQDHQASPHNRPSAPGKSRRQARPNAGAVILFLSGRRYFRWGFVYRDVNLEFNIPQEVKIVISTGYSRNVNPLTT